jgi:hypothetical protein
VEPLGAPMYAAGGIRPGSRCLANHSASSSRLLCGGLGAEPGDVSDDVVSYGGNEWTAKR